MHQIHGLVAINLIMHVLTYIVFAICSFFRLPQFNFGFLFSCFASKQKLLILTIKKHTAKY